MPVCFTVGNAKATDKQENNTDLALPGEVLQVSLADIFKRLFTSKPAGNVHNSPVAWLWL